MMLFFGLFYFVSQAVIFNILHPIGSKAFLALQLSFSKEFYIKTFAAWQAEGLMPVYKAHLYIDILHPVLYACFLISALACVMNAKGISKKWNWVLVLPVISGLCDEFENLIQFVFLSDASGLLITEPLVLFSSVFSLVKWSLAFGSLGIAFFFLLKRPHETRHRSA